MYLSGLIPHPMTAEDDYKLLENGIGFTNIVERTTRGSANLSRKEIEGGTQVLIDKIKDCKPKIAVFNGKGIYEIFSGKKDFHFGKQPNTIDGTDTVSAARFQARLNDPSHMTIFE
jgi:mismatch-specific thymine-DNA glycosylase